MSARDLPDDALRAAALFEQLAVRFLLPPPRVDVAEWAAQYRHIAKGPERGQWRNERTPYLVEPMQAASSHSVYERVVLMFPTQMGKTEVLYNSMLQRIHTDPQDMMMVQPTLQDAQDHSGQRFLPTVQQTPILNGLVAIHRSRDESSSWRTRSIQGGFGMFFAGANSASSLASKPLGFAVGDEIDKWPADVDNQGPPLELLLERMSNFFRRKLLLASTPTIKDASAIETEFMQTDMRRYHVPCPHCNERQVLEWGAKTPYGLKWAKTLTGDPRPETAVYVCKHCGGTIEEHCKTDMLAGGIWIPEKPGASLGLRAGFYINKLYSPLGWRSWSTLVEKWDQAQKRMRIGDDVAIKEFLNQSLAETYRVEGRGADSTALASRAEPYSPGIVPRGGLMVTMGVDTQPDRLEARVWAYGRGEESWLVERHIIYGDPNIDEGMEGSPWTRLTEIRRTPLRNWCGSQMLIEATMVDTGGTNTAAVYNYCRDHQASRVMAVKGASVADKAVLGKPSEQDVNWRGKNVRGVKLWSIGTDTAKHLLYGRMRLAQAGPGYVHVPNAYKNTDEFEQMTAEKLMPIVVAGKQKFRWINPPGKRNEATDCMVYAYAAACWLGIQQMREGGWERREAKFSPQAPGLFDAPEPASEAGNEPQPNAPLKPINAETKTPVSAHSTGVVSYQNNSNSASTRPHRPARPGRYNATSW